MKQHYTLSDGKATEIDVKTAVAQLLASFEREDRNEARNKRRRKEVSIDALREETGWEPVDTSVDIEIGYLAKEEKEICFQPCCDSRKSNSSL